MKPETVDAHCKQIRISIGKGDFTPVFCLNYLKNHASNPITRKEWHWVGAQLVMNGWLTVNDRNDFEAKVGAT